MNRIHYYYYYMIIVIILICFLSSFFFHYYSLKYSVEPKENLFFSHSVSYLYKYIYNPFPYNIDNSNNNNNNYTTTTTLNHSIYFSFLYCQIKEKGRERESERLIIYLFNLLKNKNYNAINATANPANNRNNFFSDWFASFWLDSTRLVKWNRVTLLFYYYTTRWRFHSNLYRHTEFGAHIYCVVYFEK